MGGEARGLGGGEGKGLVERRLRRWGTRVDTRRVRKEAWEGWKLGSRLSEGEEAAVGGEREGRKLRWRVELAEGRTAQPVVGWNP